jgi:hypothetical protein
MTYAELVETVTRLPVADRLRLVAAITRSLRDERSSPVPSGAEMLGRFRTTEPPPTDEEIQEMYTDYLVEKYR